MIEKGTRDCPFFFLLLALILIRMSQENIPHKVKILSSFAVRARLRRIAYEVFESNYGIEELIIMGIDDRGGYLAERLVSILEEIAPMKVQLMHGIKDFDHNRVVIEGDDPKALIAGKPVLIVDDVLYSGKTMFYAIAAVVAMAPVRIQTAVLIDRGHRSIPVTHDFVGMLLSTSLQQHVSVEISTEKSSATAYLL